MKNFIKTLAFLLTFVGAVHAADIRLNESVDINKASAEQLAKTLDGVGLSKAQAIVEYRRINGAFASPEALSKVKGIGMSTIENNRQRIRIH
ncbi:MAG: ComEA family DNA-binding protein [Gammaproteobacteria bacterium]|nr:ComEA family DNA-binding protein [Gammaproteobacteria bacterium]NND39889.1 ComEA family DNA-binding protein [Pseudomonadales bacterium]MBT8151249.1 ComEA family DNA-binding protein [Gammaproteobacteria bacterium]NNL10815.1 ComEA family DNA-binding protein [Pseudomonadales bacterium]NNM12124.1 ComEA family DNA-binding protein [Pseudomonadales bacterium]